LIEEADFGHDIDCVVFYLNFDHRLGSAGHFTENHIESCQIKRYGVYQYRFS
jgi:hypothetical protein